jgi:hypothetical protein
MTSGFDDLVIDAARLTGAIRIADCSRSARFISLVY